MNPFRDSLELVPRPSPWLIGFVALTHLAATVLVIVVALRLPWNWLLLLPVFASLTGGLHRARLRHRRALRRLVWRADGTWLLETASGEPFEADLQPSTVSLPSVVVLHLRCRNRARRFCLLLAPGSLSADALRRLRARLRVGARPAS